jgi:hypothetical protein
MPQLESCSRLCRMWRMRRQGMPIAKCNFTRRVGTLLTELWRLRWVMALLRGHGWRIKSLVGCLGNESGTREYHSVCTAWASTASGMTLSVRHATATLAIVHGWGRRVCKSARVDTPDAISHEPGYHTTHELLSPRWEGLYSLAC